jgi:mono/diheme cytochrome c family protein
VKTEEPVVAKAPKPPTVPTVASVLPAGPKAKPRPPRKPKPVLSISYLFSGDEAKAKGERMFHAAELGGAGNKLSCGHCHAKTDERAGLKQGDGFVRAGSSMFNAAQRPKFWGGFAPTVGKAANICQKMFMKGTGLSEQQQSELAAFVQAISADPAADLDYRVVYRTYESIIRDPTGGDAVHGKALADQYCLTCHLDGRVGPVFAPGLYEPEWVVARVRRLEGHDDDQMPAFSIARLPDSDLRDIVTFLTGPKVAPPVFDRKKSRAAAAGK